MSSHLIRSTDTDKWKRAQEFELQFAKQIINAGDDWNLWWKDKFYNYDFLNGLSFPNVLEVGCGPHTNIKFILPRINFRKVFMEDPLIQFFVTHFITGKVNKLKTFKDLLFGREDESNFLLKLFSNPEIDVDLSSAKLEELPYRDEIMDMVVCINVLDHVNDYDRCMFEINRVLRKGGMFILGQDLSNEEDLRNCPESYSDIGHPIKLDHQILEDTLEKGYTKLMMKVLPRSEGRNPTAHYGTYLGVFQKT
jgi:SAM-dependent methyltransferase